MTTLNFVCKKCGKGFDSDVGKISFPVEEERPHLEKNIICPRCGILSVDEVELTELGQTQLTEVFMSKPE
jgi:rubredoxin